MNKNKWLTVLSVEKWKIKDDFFIYGDKQIVDAICGEKPLSKHC